MTGIRARESDGLSRLLGELSPEQRANLLAQLGRAQTSAEIGIERRPAGADAPLSYGQEVLWLLQQSAPELSAYNVPRAFRVRGPVDAAALRRALDAVAARHEILRSIFPLVDGEPVQRVRPPAPVPFAEVELRHVPDAMRPAEVARIAVDAARQPFDLAHDALLQARLLRLGADDAVLLLLSHHIASDGGSRTVLLRELATLYEAELRGERAALPALSVQYADFAAWQRGPAGRAAIARSLEYWVARLADAPPALALPADRPRPPVPGFVGARIVTHYPAELLASLRALGQRHDVTLYMVVLAGLKALCARYTGQTDVTIGSPVSGRTRPEIEELVGYFVNAQPLRTLLDGDPTFAELLARVRETCVGAIDHQDAPVELVAQELQRRGRAPGPLFETVLTVEESRESGMAFGGATLEPFMVDAGGAKFDLTVAMAQMPDGTLRVGAEYRTELFDAATIERLLGHLRTLLEAAVAHPTRSISELPVLAAEERTQLLALSAGDVRHYPAAASVTSLIADQVARTPEAIAVTDDAERLTYRELDERANGLAHALAGLGVGRGDLVAVCLERSGAMVATLLGVMKAGAAYVPLDPEYPRERLSFMLEDSRARLLLTERRLLALLPEPPCATVCVDDVAAAGWPLAPEPPLAPQPDDLAYMIYTSGSTGRPKGALNAHRGVVNRLCWMQERYGLTPADRILQKTPFSFDVSVWELFWPLIAGARLVMARPGGHRDPVYLARTVEAERITVMHFVPSMLRAFLDGAELGRCGTLRHVMCSGEALPADAVADFFAALPGAALHNLYGPTECAVDVTHWTCAPDATRASVPIGRPVANTQMYVLDARREPMPIGVPGELYIGGVQVGRGYHGRPDLTAERFVADPFRRERGARLYRTGDLARWRADGTLEFLGRLDDQVKIRGFRIELGEIEAVASGHPDVAAMAVAVRHDGRGDKRLVGYYVPVAGGAAPSDLRLWLRERLPDYMVPGSLIPVPAIPVSPNGKRDLKALAALEGAEPEPRAYTAPEGEDEAAVAEIWSALLGRAQVGRDDDFYELGGHSLLAMRVVGRLRQRFGVTLPLAAMLHSATLARVAAALRDLRSAQAAETQRAIPRLPRTGGAVAVPASFAQHRFWLLERLQRGGAAYLVPVALRLAGAVDAEALHAALGDLVARHEPLRTAFALDGERLMQVVAPVAEPALELHDLTALDDSARAAEALRLADADARRPFDLERGPLLRATLLRLAADEHLLLLTAHHIIVDGWSMEIIFRELSECYAARLAGGAARLAPLALQYADFAVWQRAELDGTRRDELVRYWRDTLPAPLPSLDLPGDRPRPPAPTFSGGRVWLTLGPAEVEAVRQAAHALDATPFMAVLAAYGALLHRYGGQPQVVVGTPVAGRDRPELEPLVGLFMNTLPMCLDFAGEPTFAELVGRARQTALGAFAHQELPFEQMVEALQPARDRSRSPLFQAAFMFQNLAPATSCFGGVAVTPVASARDVAKFDLTLSITERPEGWRATLEFSADLFERATAERMLRHFRTLLAAAVAHPATPVAVLPLMSPDERARTLETWNATATPHQGTVLDLVAAKAAAHPQAAALSDAQETLTYAELAALADRVAATLQYAGVMPGSLVGLCVERSARLPAILLGILKTGAAYVPLDPEFPARRLEYMATDADLRLIVADDVGEPIVRGFGAIVLRTTDLWAATGAPSPVAVSADDLAYVLYTSGSTGQPKGVEIEHGALANLLSSMAREPGLAPGDTMLAVTTLSFDIAGLELLGPLVAGALVHVASRDDARDGRRLAALLEERAITVMQATPATWRLLVDAGWRGRGGLSAWCGGEALPAELAAQLLDRVDALWNLYGPTETTIWSTAHRVGTPAESASVGRPVANTTIYLLDRRGAPVPAGVPGELWIGGAGVARGYRNRPELTRERFRPDPFAPALAGQQRLYRTGDLARWRDDGTLLFLGRLDHQVKVRGFRIELGEIETALDAHQAVGQAVVVARDVEGERELVAYVVPAGAAVALDGGELAAWLRQSLPSYMIPAVFERLDAMPLTPNGKVDRAALPEPGRAWREAAHVPPRTPMEETVAAVFAEVLGRDAVGALDDFFELGGHSLLAARAVGRIGTALDVEIPLRAIFDAPTVAGLAEAVMRRLPGHGDLDALLQNLENMSDDEAMRLLMADEPTGGTA